MKKMSLVITEKTINLSIEKDSNNPVLILMGAKSKSTIRSNWISLKNLCDQAIKETNDLDIPEVL